MSYRKEKHQFSRRSLCIALGVFLVCAGVVHIATAKTVPVVREGSASNTGIERMVIDAPARGNKQTAEIQSQVATSSFAFTGVIAKLPVLFATDPTGIELRVRSKDGWSGWTKISILDGTPAGYAFPNGYAFSDPIMLVPSTQLQYRYSGSMDASLVEAFSHVTFIYIESGSPTSSVSWVHRIFGLSKANAEGAVPVISRSDWGANENYRLNNAGQERWARTYQPVQKFIIHHTAGINDGKLDPITIMRNIYYYHAVVLGWGDIGYNYVVDTAGRIYEGRFGGDGVVGGHAYNEQEHTDYNPGTIGISILGDFRYDTLTDATKESLTSLIAEKGQLFGVQPEGSGPFHNRPNLPNIAGHRDVDATICPGPNIYSQLGDIRTVAQTKYLALPPLPTPQFGAQQLNPAPVTVTVSSGGSTTVTAQYTNTSNIGWQTYIPSRHVTLRPVAPPSQLASAQWKSTDAVTDGDAANVPTAAVASFTIPIIPPSGLLQETEQFALFAPDATELPRTRFQLTVQVLNADYAGVVTTAAVPAASFLKMQRAVTVQVQNLGTQTWNPGDVLLSVTDIDGGASTYRATNWPNNRGGFPIQVAVAPGGTAQISIAMKTPSQPGLYANVFHLVRANGGVFATYDVQKISRADSTWQAQFVARTFPIAVKAGWSKTLIVKYKNTGITTWTRKLVLRVYDTGFHKSKFTVSGLGSGQLQEKTVPPGKTGTFIIKLKAPTRTGLYKQLLQLDIPGSTTIVQNTVSDFLTRVDK